MGLEKINSNTILGWAKANNKSLLATIPVRFNPKEIKWCPELAHDTFCTMKYSKEEIKAAYNTYAQCPFINAKLRNNEKLSQENQKLVDCLNQAINTSPAIQGTFVRGITRTRQLQINDSTIKNFVFDNKGFTSTAPIENSRYANSFALGSNSAIVEFEITDPIKGYKANNYEVIFAPKAFTADKFDIKKIEDGYYKVVQK